ncbi:hypothetical protein NQ317_003611 [Molorchus minor]|uniref:K Homology domain-containing protein n=1 Tax=Molorchus minor TaxID=1323400 RepID=A0ABQ9JJ43_9CUCU|nr:hypothetical protein NQ317_003611 [Molorchus minor]
MCDDWDDNAEVVVPTHTVYGQPIQPRNFVENDNFQGNYHNRDRGFSRNPNRDRANGRDFQRNGEGASRGAGNFNRDNRFGGRDTRYSAGGNRFGEGSQNVRNEEAEIINVPSKYVGRIIGRGGSKISELQQESGARIQVTRDTDGETTVVKLFGDVNSVAKAKSLIDELTTDTIKMVEAKDYIPEPKK